MGFTTQADKTVVQNLVASLSDGVNAIPVDPAPTPVPPVPDPTLADLQAQITSLKGQVDALQTDKASIQSKLDMAKVAAVNLVNALS